MSDGFGGPNFKPDPKLWAELEAALARPIPEQVQKDLTDLVGKYYEWQGSERSAPFQDDVRAYLTTLRNDALKLRKTIGQQDAFAIVCLREVAQECKIRNVRPGLHQQDAIQHVLTSLINATSAVKPKIAKDPSIREGESWDSLILSIRNLFKRHRLPTGVSHETIRATSSKFLMFVRALQKHFPEDLRRHDHAGDATLAKAISRLRTGSAKKRDNSRSE